jgi:hypothetical protein
MAALALADCFSVILVATVGDLVQEASLPTKNRNYDLKKSHSRDLNMDRESKQQDGPLTAGGIIERQCSDVACEQYACKPADVEHLITQEDGQYK